MDKRKNAVKNVSDYLLPNSIVTSNLAMHLDAGNPLSYAGSGTTWIDLSGNGRNATIYGSPVHTASNPGHFTLNGSNNYFNVPQLDSQTITVATAIYLEPYPSANTSKYYVIVRQGFNPINFSMYLDNYQYRPYLDGSGAGDFTSSGYFCSVQSWQYIVATFNWTNYSYKLYINGINVISTTWNSTNSGTYTFNNTSQSYNTTDISRNVSNNNSFIYGKIALFKLYTIELSDSQIMQNYSFYKNRFNF